MCSRHRALQYTIMLYLYSSGWLVQINGCLDDYLRLYKPHRLTGFTSEKKHVMQDLTLGICPYFLMFNRLKVFKVGGRIHQWGSEQFQQRLNRSERILH